MTRETANSEETGFNWVVYGEMSMAKETVSTRVAQAIAEQVDRYAEIHEISRTETIELFIRTALENPEAYKEKRTYTGRIREDWHPEPPHRDPEHKIGLSDSIEKRVHRKLPGTEVYTGEWEEREAISARLPGEIVRGIEDWGESQDMNKANAAADLIERGLRADPLPDDHTVGLEGERYTVELDPEEADAFRRYRLGRHYTPSECVSALLGASRSTKSIRLDWAKPEDIEE